jgi:hypothetical protein
LPVARFLSGMLFAARSGTSVVKEGRLLPVIILLGVRRLQSWGGTSRSAVAVP